MSHDIFIEFENQPEHDDVDRLLRLYVRGIADVGWNGGQRRWYVTLPGKPSEMDERRPASLLQTERWFEVYFAPGEPMDVITRSVDAVTQAIADGFAAFAVRRWGGKRDED